MRKLALLITLVALLVASATVLANSYTAPSTDPAPEVPLITNAI